MRGPNYGPKGYARIDHQVCTPLALFRAPLGAPTSDPIDGFVSTPASIFCTSLIRLRAPAGSLSMGSSTTRKLRWPLPIGSSIPRKLRWSLSVGGSIRRKILRSLSLATTIPRKLRSSLSLGSFVTRKLRGPLSRPLAAPRGAKGVAKNLGNRGLPGRHDFFVHKLLIRPCQQGLPWGPHPEVPEHDSCEDSEPRAPDGAPVPRKLRWSLSLEGPVPRKLRGPLSLEGSVPREVRWSLSLRGSIPRKLLGSLSLAAPSLASKINLYPWAALSLANYVGLYHWRAP